jgi:phosphatidylserine decarboxylase
LSIAREAWPFVLPVVLGAGLAWIAGWRSAALVLAVAALALAAFFRVPQRRFRGDSNAVLAPANGVVTAIDRVEEPEVGPGTFHRIVTFLSVFNVHVQRAPVGGEVVASRFREGRKLAAFRTAAGDLNQNHLLVLRLEGDERVGVKQIAGLLARRVVCHARVGERLERGQLFGIIKFGSRVDLYVPENWKPMVRKGDKLVEGLTVVAVSS